MRRHQRTVNVGCWENAETDAIKLPHDNTLLGIDLVGSLVKVVETQRIVGRPLVVEQYVVCCQLTIAIG